MTLIWFLHQLFSYLIGNIWKKRVMGISKIPLSITRWHMKMTTTISISTPQKITETLICFLVLVMEIPTPWTEVLLSNSSCFHLHLKVTRKKRLTLELTINITSIMISKLNKKTFSTSIRRKERVPWRDLPCLPSPSLRQNPLPCTTSTKQAHKSIIKTSTSSPSQFTTLLTIESITLQYQCRDHSLIIIKMEALLVTAQSAKRRRTSWMWWNRFRWQRKRQTHCLETLINSSLSLRRREVLLQSWIRDNTS